MFGCVNLVLASRTWYAVVKWKEASIMLEWILVNLPMIICLLAGMALVVVEVFMPGFGVPGISGIALLAVSVWLMWVNIGPLAALGLIICIVAAVAIVLSLALRSTARGALSKSSLVLNDTLDRKTGFLSNADLTVFLGKEGITQTVLRPAGIADFDGVRLNVVSEGGYIQPNVKVVIEQVEGSRIVVRSVNEHTSEDK